MKKWIGILLAYLIGVGLAGCSSILGLIPGTPGAQAATCVPFTTPTPVGTYAPPTATPNMATPHIIETLPTPFYPTMTPVPIDRLVDLAPGLPEESKYQVLINRCNGSRELWQLGLWMDTNRIPMGPGDSQVYVTYWFYPGEFGPAARNDAIPPDKPRKISLDYDHNPTALLFEADSNNFPGAPFTYMRCNHFPDLRIWGDGRVVYRDDQQALLVGQIDENHIRQILTLLYDLHFFDPWVVRQSPSPAGTYFSIEAILKVGDYSYEWYTRPDLFTQVVTLLDPANLTPFIPQEAVFNEAPYEYGYAPQGGFPEWPGRLSFTPDDAGVKKVILKGDDLAYLWQVLQTNQFPVMGFQYHGRNWAVWLTIPGVTDEQTTSHCIPFWKPDQMPTPTYPSYPAPNSTPTQPVPPSPYPYPVIQNGKSQ